MMSLSETIASHLRLSAENAKEREKELREKERLKAAVEKKKAAARKRKEIKKEREAQKRYLADKARFENQGLLEILNLIIQGLNSNRADFLPVKKRIIDYFAKNPHNEKIHQGVVLFSITITDSTRFVATLTCAWDFYRRNVFKISYEGGRAVLNSDLSPSGKKEEVKLSATPNEAAKKIIDFLMTV